MRRLLKSLAGSRTDFGAYYKGNPSAVAARLRGSTSRLSKCAAVATFLAFLSLPAAAAETDWPKVAAALGKSGSEMPGGVYRVGLPRTDLHVTLDGVELKAGFALGSWLAFRTESGRRLGMGGVRLPEDAAAPGGGR